MKMGLREAAFQVLKEAGKPLNADDIAKRILDAELWETAGKTPGASVSAALYIDIKSKGDKSAFVNHDRGSFALRDVGPRLEYAKVLPMLFEDKLSSANAPAENVPALRDANAEPRDVFKAPAEPVKVLPSFESYTFIECAEKVLEAFGNKKPMHYSDITQKALKKGWLVTEGKTPEASMGSAVFNENKRRQKRGELARFIQHGGGFLSLSQWEESGQEFQLEFQIAQQNQEVKKTLKERLLAMDPIGFEGLVKELLEVIGFKAERTPPTHDKGIDVRGTLVVGDVIRIKMAVQVKRFRLKTNVGAPVVQQLRGSLGAHEQGLIITTSDFSKGAKIEAARSDTHPIALMNGNELVALLMEHEVGVKCFTHPLFKIKEAFFSGECTDDLDIEID